MKPEQNSRRLFLKLAASSAGLVFSGLSLPLFADSITQPSVEFQLLTIHPDNTITIYNTRAEMGQGVMTSLAQLLLEDLDVSWQQIKQVKNAWADNERFGHQTTIGAISSLLGWQSHRQMGAKINLLIKQTAAKIWRIEESSISTDKGMIRNDITGQKLTYGQLTNALQGKTLAEQVELKPPEKFKLIGKSMPRLDVPDKITGKALFGIDQMPKGVKIAVIARCPVFGGTVTKVDSSLVDMNKVIKIITIEQGVVVIADNYWVANQAREKLNIEWDYGDFKNQSSERLMQMFADQIKSNNGKQVANVGNIDDIFASDIEILTTEFSFPFVGHATMEPMNCTVWFHDGECQIWAPTQNPQDARTSAANILQIDESKVRVDVTLIGGGFGRRAQDDFVIEACEVAKKCHFPIKVIWSREDDLQHDYYRPANKQQIKANIKAGKIIAWQHSVATLSTAPFHFSLRDRNTESGDWVAYGGSEKSLYEIPNFQTQVHLTKTPMPVGILRGISHGYVNFAAEVSIDKLASSANVDPISFRLNHISVERARQVLMLMADKIKELELTEQQYVGMAFGHEKAPQGPYQYYNSIAVVIERMNEGLKIKRIIAILDHGQVINPDGLLAQTQGAVMFALSMMFHQEITIKEGQVLQSNFHDYPVSRMGSEVEVELHTLGNHDWPMGTGEKLQGTIQPAIANAIYAASGKSVTQLPINLTSWENEHV